MESNQYFRKTLRCYVDQSRGQQSQLLGLSGFSLLFQKGPSCDNDIYRVTSRFFYDRQVNWYCRSLAYDNHIVPLPFLLVISIISFDKFSFALKLVMNIDIHINYLLCDNFIEVLSFIFNYCSHI